VLSHLLGESHHERVLECVQFGLQLRQRSSHGAGGCIEWRNGEDQRSLFLSPDVDAVVDDDEGVEEVARVEVVAGAQILEGRAVRVQAEATRRGATAKVASAHEQVTGGDRQNRRKRQVSGKTRDATQKQQQQQRSCVQRTRRVRHFAQ